MPVFVEVEGEGDWSGERGGDGLEFAELANYGGVLESVAGIFAGGDVGVKIFFGDGNPQFEARVGKRRRRRIEAKLEGAGIWL